MKSSYFSVLTVLAGFCGCLASASFAAAPIKHKDVWRWPMDGFGRSSIAQGFAEYGAFVAGKHHTGLDIDAPQNTPVKAVADGYVFNLVPNGLPGCGSGSCTDHGDGNTIILYHKAYFGKKGPKLVYSHYQHLDHFRGDLEETIENPNGPCKRYGKDDGSVGDPNHVSVYGWTCPLVDAVRVKAGDVIGYSGASGFGQQHYAPYGWHLHFEAKTFGALYSYECFDDSNCCPDHKCFGYSKAHPFEPIGCKKPDCKYGYLDPLNWLEKVDKKTIKTFLHVKIGPDGEGTTLWLGPNREYDSQTTWHSSDGEYWAHEVGPVSDQCDKGWYKITKVNSYPPPVGDYFAPTNTHRDGPGSLSDTWVCIGNGNLKYVVDAP